MKIFLPYENIPLNGNIFYRMKTLYQMKLFLLNKNIFFVSNENIFYRMEIYILSNENIFLSNENIFLSNENNFYRILLHFGNHNPRFEREIKLVRL